MSFSNLQIQLTGDHKTSAKNESLLNRSAWTLEGGGGGDATLVYRLVINVYLVYTLVFYC